MASDAVEPALRRTPRARVLSGFAGRAAAELGRPAEATDHYRVFLTQSDQDFFGEGFHHGVADEYRARAEAWLRIDPGEEADR